MTVYGVSPTESSSMYGTTDSTTHGTVVQLGLYSRNAYLIPLPDVFNPPVTTATFKDIL